VILGDGWLKYNIWEHSPTVHELYARRCRMEAEEMTCAAQAAEVLKKLVKPGETLLDVGCGAGYFYHSLRARGISAEYYGIDGSPTLIEIGRSILKNYGLPPERLQSIRIEDLDGAADHVLCMNVLSNIDNYHRPLERLLNTASKTLVLRESIAEKTEYNYVTDKYLDKDLKVYVNTYSEHELREFIESYGFDVEFVEDKYTRGEPQLVIDHPHYWKFAVARRRK